MPNPVVYLLSTAIELYVYVLIASIILSWLIAFKIVNAYQPFVYKLNDMLRRITEPVLTPIRHILPDLGGIDISPIILILLLNFIQYSLVYYLG